MTSSWLLIPLQTDEEGFGGAQAHTDAALPEASREADYPVCQQQPDLMGKEVVCIVAHARVHIRLTL